jgi:hypothetical protein
MNRRPVLSDAQREVLETAHFFLDDREIARYWTLSDEDLASIERRRRDSNRFGYSSKMLRGGRVMKLESARKDTGEVDRSALDIELELNFKILMKKVVLDIHAKEDKAKAWNVESANARS